MQKLVKDIDARLVRGVSYITFKTWTPMRFNFCRGHVVIDRFDQKGISNDTAPESLELFRRELSLDDGIFLSLGRSKGSLEIYAIINSEARGIDRSGNGTFMIHREPP